jgi:glyoxylase I family protein
VPAGFHHVTLRVTDLGRARAFYAGVLGFTVDQDFPGEKLRLRFGDGARLVLHPLLPDTPAGDRFTEARVGLDHIAVAASRDEVTQLAAALRAAGVPADLHHDPIGPLLVSFRDPDNIQWEFFEDT